MKRFREDLKVGREKERLLEFHAKHKLLLRAHSEKHCRAMGKLTAPISGLPLAEAYDRYGKLLAEALKLKATTKKNANVLQHQTGHFKKDLSPDEQGELAEIVDSYRKGLLPLIVPVMLLAHYARKYDNPYLSQQVYLSPCPLELRLRNHA